MSDKTTFRFQFLGRAANASAVAPGRIALTIPGEPVGTVITMDVAAAVEMSNALMQAASIAVTYGQEFFDRQEAERWINTPVRPDGES
jgi:hypothetical protein